MATKSTTIIPISLPTELARKINMFAKKESMTRSEFARDALRKKIAWLELDSARNQFSRAAYKAGVRTFPDAVHETAKIRYSRGKRLTKSKK